MRINNKHHRKVNILVLLISLIISDNSFAQIEYVFFSDSPNNSYYDPSWGYANDPSFVELAGPSGNKFPVDTTNVFSGENSLKLNWQSSSGGNWALASAAINWLSHDATQMDSLRMMIFANSSVPISALPKIYLEDVNNNKTTQFNISDFVDTVLVNEWQLLSIPLDVFVSDPGAADLTKIKTIFFGQNSADGTQHTFYIDDLKLIKSQGIGTPPNIPQNISAKGFDRHIDISWDLNSENDIALYRVYKKDGDTYTLIGSSRSTDRFYAHFIGESGIENSYAVTAVNTTNNESEKSADVTSATYEMTDDELLTMVQEATFRYYWDYAHPVSGLSFERYPSRGAVTSGGSGFGVMAILVGIERGFITRQQGIDRMLTIVNFLGNNADRFHGAWSHWLNGETGTVIPFSTMDDGGDIVETSFMIQGLLTARQYFDGESSDEIQLRNLITNLWETVEWSWYRKSPHSTFIYWHWSPNYGWLMDFRLLGYNEAMITYLVAIASPTYPIPVSNYHDGWASGSNFINGNNYYGYKLYVGKSYGGPLFFTHYSFLGFDPREKRDAYANYFIHNKNHTLINREYCIQNPNGFTGYDSLNWGLTASDDPWGYRAHQPFSTNDNGTITPTAALSSIPYTPEESIAAMKNFYRNHGENLWGIYGFKDAYNPGENWYADSYISIDQGPIIVMIENYRTGLLWSNFMKDQEIVAALDLIGFVEDVTDINDSELLSDKFELRNNYPNPFNPSTKISYSIPTNEKVTLKIFDLLGREIDILINEFQSKGNYKITWEPKSLSSGIYLYKISAGKYFETKKMIYLK